MRRFAALALLFSMFAASHGPLSAQTRPRRVGSAGSTAHAPTQPSRPATEPARPTARPTPFPRSQPSARTQPPPRETAGVEEVGEDEVVRVDTSLVTVPVSVLDRDGRFIAGLRQEDFRIFEDGAEQRVAYFATVEQPFTVALVIDTSGSTRFNLEDIQDAAIAFLDQLRPADRVLVVSFDDDVRLLASETNDRRLLRDAVRRTRTGDWTRLYDAVDFTFQRLRHVSGRKAVVLFTDGVDTRSKRASYQSTLEDAEELDALIYPVQYDTVDNSNNGGGGGGNWPAPNPRRRGGRRSGIGDILEDILGGGQIIIGGGGRNPGGGRGGGGGGNGPDAEAYRLGGQYLRALAQMTGGRHHNADDLNYLERAFSNIAEELRRQYSIGYYPSRTASAPERRQLRVRVKRPNLVVRARDSYVYKPSGGAPAPSSTTAQDNATRPELRPRQLREAMRE